MNNSESGVSNESLRLLPEREYSAIMGIARGVIALLERQRDFAQKHPTTEYVHHIIERAGLKGIEVTYDQAVQALDQTRREA